MRLPPGFLDELRSRTSLHHVVSRKVSWDRRKSQPGKGDWWAPCPFHEEKTASFHIDDRKGFYYCFGCQAKGDAIGFVQETDNLDFMAAIEMLAREAGMQMPAADPQAEARARQVEGLVGVMEEAVKWCRLQLATIAGAEARAYLERRGLSPADQDRWGIGFAPRAGLFQHLTGKGVSGKDVIAAGLALDSTRGGDPYDRFRNRIMFPIRDARGRAIAFGGRAMDPGDKAKYLNSPETPVFDKGRTLYNIGPARAAAGPDSPLIVSEGYMDVIALGKAGFDAAVAPLGTAITPDQLQLMWRLHPEPIVALDGDAAGLRAAMRLVDLALPLIGPERSLRFCLLPEGQDPDDLIRAGGRDAMHALLDAAEPLVRLLWRRETDGRQFDSPERKAALDRALTRATGQITDPGLRRHYDDDLRQLKWQAFRGQRMAGRGRQRPGDAPLAMAETRTSALAQADAGRNAEKLREVVILAIVLKFPRLLPRFESALERADFSDRDAATLRDSILRNGAADDLGAAVREDLGAGLLDRLMSSPHLRVSPALRDPGDPAFAAMCLEGEFDKLVALGGARHELEEALADFDDRSDEGLTWRLAQAAEAMARAARPRGAQTEFETAANGARISRAERESLDSLLSRIGLDDNAGPDADNA